MFKLKKYRGGTKEFTDMCMLIIEPSVASYFI